MKRPALLVVVGLLLICGAILLRNQDPPRSGIDDPVVADGGAGLVTNSSSIPGGIPRTQEGSVTSALRDLGRQTTESLQQQQDIVGNVEAQTTPEQQQKLAARLDEVQAATIRSYTRAQLKGTLQLLRRALSDSEYPGVRSHRDSSQGVARLSWRVHLLPVLGHRKLYDEFHLDEPWDSAHNSTLLEKMPLVYRHWNDSASATKTRFLAVSAAGALCERGFLRPLSDVVDPESDTIALIVAGAQLAVPWTSPHDFPMAEETFSQPPGQVSGADIMIGTVEGAALTFPATGSYAAFEAMATIAGGEDGALDAMMRQTF